MAPRIGGTNWTPRRLAWARAHAARPRLALIPIALQCDLQKDFEQVLRASRTAVKVVPRTPGNQDVHR